MERDLKGNRRAERRVRHDAFGRERHTALTHSHAHRVALRGGRAARRARGLCVQSDRRD